MLALVGDTAASSGFSVAKFDRNLTPTTGYPVEGHPIALAVEAGGDAIVVGSALGPQDARVGDVNVWRYTPDGYLRWKQELGSEGLGIAANVDAAGNAFVLWSGSTLVNGGTLVISELDREGTLLASRGLGMVTSVLAVNVDRHGHVLLVSADPEYVLHKYDTTGDELWTSPLDGYAGGIHGSDDDSALVVGTSDAGAAALTRLGARGTEVFSITFGGGSDFPGLVAADALGRAFVVGSTQKSGTQDFWDGWVRLFDTTGAELESWPLASDGTDAPKAVVVDSTGALVIAGTTEGALPGQTHFGGKDAFLARVVP